MSTRGGTQKSKTGVPVSAFVIVIVIAIVFAAVALWVWLSLQDCIIDARNNICPSIQSDPNAS